MLNLISKNYYLSEKLLNLLSENVLEAVLFLADDKVLFANEAFIKIFKFTPDDLIGLPVKALIAALGLMREDEYLSEKDFEAIYNDEYAVDINFTGADGRKSILQMKIRPFLTEQEINGKLIIFRDITQKIASLIERDRLYKISTLGKISAGIAHDLNRLLSVIYLENTKLLLNTSKRNKESLEKMETAITQAIGIVSRIRDFGKLDKLSTTLININELIEKTLALLKTYWEAENNLRCKKIDITFSPGPLQANQNVQGNLASLSSVLINLINNAMDAIKEKGEIRISTTCHDGRIYISVSDDGVGMTPDVQLNLFQPYYSTKQDRGTGLGLFISREVIREHKGSITMISTTEKGSTFIISLPQAPEQANREKTKVIPAENLIFIIEDEKPISTILQELFLEAGYKVITSQTGYEALKYLKKSKPSLVLSDLCVPGLPFYEVAKSIKSIDVNIPIVLLSGYGSDIDDETRNSLGIKAVISKPFSNEGLLKTVERILEAKGNISYIDTF